MRAAKILNWLLISILITHTTVAGAVCLDSKLVSGYHQPLKEELASSVAVIIGVPVAVRNLSEDPSDSGWTAMIYRVRVLNVLRGTAGNEMDLRDENDSGRFGFQLGQEYVLFVGRHGAQDGYSDSAEGAYFVSNCGNSGLMSERKDVLRQLATADTASEPKSLLAAVEKHFRQVSGSAIPHHRYALVDLNSDGIPDAVVLLTDQAFCGSGGCTLEIYRGTGTDLLLYPQVP